MSHSMEHDLQTGSEPATKNRASIWVWWHMAIAVKLKCCKCLRAYFCNINH